MIDSHCHLNLDPLYQDWPKFLETAQEAGINTILVPGVDLYTSKKAIEIASKSNSIWAMAGIHPHRADKINSPTKLKDLIGSLKSLAKSGDIIAIGECGLDYFKLENQATKKLQQQLFIAQLKLAKQLNLPVSIHVRDAHNDAIKILSQFQPRGVLHCFSGNQAYLKKALDLGLFISFAGNITFKNAQNLQEFARAVPLDRLLLETDAPYLNPHRGVWPNTPAHIAEVYKFVASLTDLPTEKLVNQVTENSHTLFKIPI